MITVLEKIKLKSNLNQKINSSRFVKIEVEIVKTIEQLVEMNNNQLKPKIERVQEVEKLLVNKNNLQRIQIEIALLQALKGVIKPSIFDGETVTSNYIRAISRK